MFAPILRFEEGQAGVVPSPLPRSWGAVELEFLNKRGRTCAHRVFQAGVMRARFPNVAVEMPPEAVLINTAGGLTGGDCMTVGIEMGAGTRATVTTQAHEKIYRACAGEVSVISNMRVGPGGSLEWLPQPTILFDKARLARETHVALSETSMFLGVEAVIFGRTAMGEAITSGALSDSWTIRRGGRLIHADRFMLGGDIAAALAQPLVLAGNAAMATIRLVAEDAAAKLEAVRASIADCGAASAWNGMLLARIVTKDGYQLGMALTRALTALRGRPLPPVWRI
ncbi:MAG TPA: urease accessory protein UreD [Rhizomicrobium sp.]|nr:urease accessory protein UreD [Rhizomicrobium sp.]